MAKERGEKAAKSKYRPEDVSAFVETLDAYDAEKAASVEVESMPSRRRKIQVQEERSQRATKIPLGADDGGESLSNVLGRGSSQDMQHLTKSKKGFPWGIIISIMAILAIVSVAGFFVFNRAKKFTNTNVQLQFKPITTAVSGSTLTVTIEYQNLEPVDLTNTEVTVQYPDGFTYASSAPNADQAFHNSFKIGRIKTGQSGKVVITGTVLGAIGDTRVFDATMTYRPATFNSDFQMKASTQVAISSSSLDLLLSGPTQLAAGGTGTWTITYTNTSIGDLKNVQVAATYPDGFTFISSNPATQNKTPVWKISSVKKGATGTITFTGTVAGNLGDSFSFQASVGLVSGNDVVELQNQQTLLVILVKTGVTTSVAVNGSTDPVVIAPGETLNYLVRVTNSSDVEVTNLTVMTKLDGASVDLTKLANDSKAKVSGTTLTWTKDQISGLADMKPGDAVSLSFAIGTQAGVIVKTDADRDQKVTATVNVTAPSLTANTNISAQPGIVVVTKISTVLTLSSDARYYMDATTVVGSGPVPPVVGKTTTYRAIWYVTNTTSDATTMVVSARLPNSVLWTGKNLARDAGDLNFDPGTRLISWTLNTLPAGTGSRLPALTARFDLSITPTAEQVGTIPVLMETSTAIATDAFTTKSLSSPAATITTAIPNDPKDANQGTVVAQ